MSNPDFSSYQKAPFLSKEAIDLHISLYEKYKENTDKLLNQIPKLDTDSSNPNNSEYRDHIVNCRHNYNASILHQFYFDGISFEKTNPPQEFKDFLEQHNSDAYNWTNFSDWQNDLIALAKASRGWVLFGFSTIETILANVAVDQHDIGIPPGFIPLLVLDVWEHAYVKDFGTDRQAYIEEWFKYIDWNWLISNCKRITPIIENSDYTSRVVAGIEYKYSR